MTRQAIPGIEVTAPGQLTAGQIEDVRRLVDAVAKTDGVPPFSDHVLLQLSGSQAQNLLAHHGGQLVGFAHVEAPTQTDGYAAAELAVHPEHRGRGAGTALLAGVIDSAPGGAVRIWSHGQGAGDPSAAALAAAALATRFGFRQVRSLWQMRAALPDDLPPVTLPAGVTLRAFIPGQDEQAWTRLSNLAFASHPEQGGWTEADVRLREAEDWFDPAGFLLAERSGAGLVGFHWTKVHARDLGGPEELRDSPVGEVYVIGVDPAEAGQGLGQALTVAGLQHLAGRGLASVILYVDEENTRAIALYRRLGFDRWNTDISYQREPES